VLAFVSDGYRCMHADFARQLMPTCLEFLARVQAASASEDVNCPSVHSHSCKGDTMTMTSPKPVKFKLEESNAVVHWCAFHIQKCQENHDQDSKHPLCEASIVSPSHGKVVNPVPLPLAWHP
jgi:hypothetical protein